MTARETIAEAFRRGINITVEKGAISCGPQEKIDAELDVEIGRNASEIALLLGGRGVDQRKQLIKILPAAEVRSMLAEMVFQKTGFRTNDPSFYLNWFQCSEQGDVRVEIRANLDNTERWRG